LRNEKGFAIRADYDEPGLLVGAIRDDLPFEGYYNDDGKTEEKILRNLFKEGDVYFDTGDLLKKDKEYKLTFRYRKISVNSASYLTPSGVYIFD